MYLNLFITLNEVMEYKYCSTMFFTKIFFRVFYLHKYNLCLIKSIPRTPQNLN